MNKRLTGFPGILPAYRGVPFCMKIDIGKYCIVLYAKVFYYYLYISFWSARKGRY